MAYGSSGRTCSKGALSVMFFVIVVTCPATSRLVAANASSTDPVNCDRVRYTFEEKGLYLDTPKDMNGLKSDWRPPFRVAPPSVHLDRKGIDDVEPSGTLLMENPKFEVAIATEEPLCGLKCPRLDAALVSELRSFNGSFVRLAGVVFQFFAASSSFIEVLALVLTVP
ncbi:hypothetical protein AAG570_000315 [Ranatra chinensis]|uniref:Uncharacterized protein n=1 Tax=Ranatra chinensis TaxID=642074 RepID=A0ABD0ZDM1_9HEMI